MDLALGFIQQPEVMGISVFPHVVVLPPLVLVILVFLEWLEEFLFLVDDSAMKALVEDSPYLSYAGSLPVVCGPHHSR